MKATEVKAILITVHHKVEGDEFLETNCRDYDHYKELPEVVQFQGKFFGLTGWNSDKQTAYYTTAVRIAFPH